MNPAAAFHAAAASVLRDRGERASQRAVAAIVGEHQQLYGAYVRGRSHIGTAKIAAYLRRWADTGRAPITLTWTVDTGWLAAKGDAR